MTTLTDIDAFWTSLDSEDNKPTQLDRYIARSAPLRITKFISLGGGTKMGTTLEKFARFRFKNLVKRKTGTGQSESGYDHLIKAPADIYVEQKSSGHWGEDDFKWQHVEPAHKWNMLLLCGIGYTDVHFWAMSRATFTSLVASKKITVQGNKTGESSQGMWFTYSCVKDSLIAIRTPEELQAFAASL